MNILALDAASKTGWAIYRDGEIITGVQDFSKRRGDSNGMVYLRLIGWLESLPFKPDVVYFEQPHHRGAGTALLLGLAAHVQSWAMRHGAEYTEVHTGTVKKAVGCASKEAVMDWFRKEYRRDPQTDDESDAAALLHYAMQELGVLATVVGKAAGDDF